MGREFNVTGICNPEWHYMAETTAKLNKIIGLIEKRKYFTINRPRQYGKSTSLVLLQRRLEEDYLVLRFSLERVSKESYRDLNALARTLYLLFKEGITKAKATTLLPVLDGIKQVEDALELSWCITELCEASNKEIILLIDEVDDGTNNDVFLRFLSILRDKYNERNAEGTPTFKSVILAGVHDVKNLHFKVTGREEFRKNSPWNIATNFTIDMELDVIEIRSLLEDYLSEHSEIEIDIDLIANRIHYFTSGYPFLVSYLCKHVEENFEGVCKWNEHNLEQAVNQILDSDNTNFDSLIKNLENHEDLYRLVKQIVLEGRQFRYSSDASAIQKGRLYGILAPNDRGTAKIHNPIYEMRIYNYLTERLQTEVSQAMPTNHTSSTYINPDGSLNMELAFENYSMHLKSLYDDGQDAFVEKNARLLFGIFMKTIINGIGFFLPESQIADRLRPDITITYNRFKYLVELKIWDGDQYYKKSIEQLYGYLLREGLNTGYLLFHDFRKVRHQRFTHDTINKDGKTIHTYFV